MTQIYEISARKTVEKDVKVPYFLTQQDLTEIKRLTQKYQDSFWLSLSREITARDSLGIKSYYDPVTMLLIRKEDKRFRQGFISRITSSINGEVAASAVLSKSKQVAVMGKRNGSIKPFSRTRLASHMVGSHYRQAVFSEPHLVWRVGEGENNCQQCTALDGTAWLVDDPSIMRPVEDSHPRCTCSLELVDAELGEGEETESIVGELF